MQAAIAEVVARTTREQATTDARTDIQELRRRAFEAGRDRSRKIIKTSRIDTRTGEIRYNPAGRVLRDWYLHVYLNTLRSNLGEPAVPIDAQQVEDTTAHLHRIRPETEALHALRAVGVVRDVALDDAAHAAADIVVHLGRVAGRRAVLHARDDRFDGDQLAIHVTRHWYQRCYGDHVQGVTKSRQPLAEVTGAEQHQVSLTLASGQARRLIARNGTPLVTVHGMVATDIDRRLAGGATQLVSPISDQGHHTAAAETLRTRITRTWRDLDPHARAMWLRISGADTAAADLPWRSVGGDEQTRIIRLYLDTHRPGVIGVPFSGQPIELEPRFAAMAMFGHRRPLDASALVDPSLEPDRATSALTRADLALGQTSSRTNSLGTAR